MASGSTWFSQKIDPANWACSNAGAYFNPSVDTSRQRWQRPNRTGTRGRPLVAKVSVLERGQETKAFQRIAASANARHIPALDALRAASALLVILYHCGVPYIPASLGVTVFFVISGFLITWILLKEYDQRGTISLRNFYGRRSFRIFPAFYVFWAIMIAATLFRHAHVLWGQALSSFFYVCNYYQGTHGYPSSAFSRTWSLAVEEQFYLLWPLLFRTFARNQEKLSARAADGHRLGMGIAVCDGVCRRQRSLHLHGLRNPLRPDHGGVCNRDLHPARLLRSVWNRVCQSAAMLGLT